MYHGQSGFSTKTAPFKVTHDDLIAKLTGFLSCLRSKHLTLPVPSFRECSFLLYLSGSPTLLASPSSEEGSPVTLGNLLTIMICRLSLRIAEWAGQKEAWESLSQPVPQVILHSR